MRHILAVAILGVSLASTVSAAFAYSDNNNSGIPQRSWDGVVVQPQQVVLYTAAGSAVAGAPSTGIGPGFDGYNPYLPTPGNSK